MEGEFNNLDCNNTNITFSVATNNTATSDETSADPIYQRSMGTAYSRGKKVSKAVVITGIAITFTAVVLSGRAIIRNIYVPSPPEVVSPTILVEEGVFKYSFIFTNKLEYKSTMYLNIDGKVVLEKDCSEAKEYSGEYSPVAKGSKYKFYVTFTNSFDYYKTIYSVEGIY